MKDTYRSVAGHRVSETKVKGSRFVARAFPATDEAEADDRIASIRKEHYDATHHCTAYRVGVAGETFRYNDDGEPSGTAGPPILRQIDARDLTNTLVIVTRYYGGTKLGTGGLIRAYGDAASGVLDAAPLRTHVIRVPVRIRFAYDDTSPAMHLIDTFDAEIVETEYTEETEIVVAVRRSQAEDFAAAFVEALGGRGAVEVKPA